MATTLSISFERVRSEIGKLAASLCRDSFADFCRHAIAAGVVAGIAKLEWGWHLDAHCFSVQMQLESWLVAYGVGTAEMVSRQREAWQREDATWEDGEPEPWLRYVLVQNQIDNLPPGTLKSTIAMVLANCWIWLWEPRFAFGASSGMDANVDRDSQAARDVVRSSWYRETFAITWRDVDVEAQSPIEIRRDDNAVGDWGTTKGGKRVSRTISSGFTGTHVDATFIDDPDDADKVWSEPERLRPQNRFTRAIENRVNCENRSLRRVLQQVVHVEGFTAYLLSIAVWSPATPKGWARLCIAAEFGMGPADAPEVTPYGWRDPRTEPGETMHPRLSAGVLADKRQKMPGYEGQYNQNPARFGVGMWAARHARFWIFDHENPDVLRRRPEGAPSRDQQPPIVIKLSDLNRITLSVDAANSIDPKPNAKVSAVGLIVGGCRRDERYMLDDRTRVLGASATYRAIYDVLRAWQIERVLIEKKAMGPSAIAAVELAIRRGWFIDDDTDDKIELLGPDGRRVRAVVEAVDPGKEDKVQRAFGSLPTWNQGLIFFHDGAPWLYPTVDANRKTVDEGTFGEITMFPKSRRKDRMDSLTQFIAKYQPTNGVDRLRALNGMGAALARAVR